MKATWIKRVLLVAALAAFAPNCGDSGDDAAKVTESPNIGDKTSKKLTAAEGGEVALDDAGVKLTVPAGALSGDEEISAEVVKKTGLPDAANLAGNVIEFLPDGLKFNKPVALEIDLAGATVPEKATVSIAWLDEDKGEWVNLEGSKLVDGKVVAETTHFTTFAIRFEVNEDGDVVQTGGACGGDFNACGGDLEGSWTIESGCADVPASLLEQVQGACKGSTFSIGVDVTGPISFANGKISGTLHIMNTEEQSLPKSCVSDMMCPEADDGETVVDTGDACVTTKNEEKDQPIDETYTVDGGKIVVGDDSTPVEYCVDGNSLRVRQAVENGVFIEWNAKRN